MRHLFVVGSLDKHMQNEKEFILPSAGVGGVLCLCVQTRLSVYGLAVKELY